MTEKSIFIGCGKMLGERQQLQGGYERLPQSRKMSGSEALFWKIKRDTRLDYRMIEPDDDTK